MSDWNRGEEFHLELDAKVTARDPLPAVFVEVQADGWVFRVPIGVLDKHATKIQRPFKFGDQVWWTDGSGRDFRGVVVNPNVSSRGYIEVVLGRRTGKAATDEHGHLHSSSLQVRNLTLIDPQEDSDE